MPSSAPPYTSPSFPAIHLERLSYATGISANGIWRIFRGNRRPSFEAAKRIAEALQVSLDELYAELEPKWQTWEQAEWAEDAS